jgi:hypothetical protein
LWISVPGPARFCDPEFLLKVAKDGAVRLTTLHLSQLRNRPLSNVDVSGVAADAQHSGNFRVRWKSRPILGPNRPARHDGDGGPSPNYVI